MSINIQGQILCSGGITQYSETKMTAMLSYRCREAARGLLGVSKHLFPGGPNGTTWSCNSYVAGAKKTCVSHQGSGGGGLDLVSTLPPPRPKLPKTCHIPPIFAPSPPPPAPQSLPTAWQLIYCNILFLLAWGPSNDWHWPPCQCFYPPS